MLLTGFAYIAWIIAPESTQRSQLRLQNTPTESLQKGKTPASNKCLGYDTKPSDSNFTKLFS